MKTWRERARVARAPPPALQRDRFQPSNFIHVGASVPARALARTPQSDLIHCQIHLNALSQRTRSRCYHNRIIPGRRSRLSGAPSTPTAAATSSAPRLYGAHHQDHEQHAKQLPPWSTPHAAESEEYQRDRKRVL